MVQRAYNRYSTVRTEMIAETTHFLDWALQNARSFPRIPRVRVDSGVRFSERVKIAFWSAALLEMTSIQKPPAK